MPPHVFKPTLCSHRSTANLGYDTVTPFHAKGFVEWPTLLQHEGQLSPSREIKYNATE
jgi:hypothetical protein